MNQSSCIYFFENKRVLLIYQVILIFRWPNNLFTSILWYYNDDVDNILPTLQSKSKELYWRSFSQYRSSMFIQFGISSRLPSVTRVHSLGLALYIIYFSLYYKYCSNKVSLTHKRKHAFAFVNTLFSLIYTVKNNLNINEE